MNTITHVPITKKEAEALAWGLAQIGDYLDREPTEASDPLFILLSDGFSHEAIGSTCTDLFIVAYSGVITSPLTNLEKAILRLCVENTSWIDSHHRSVASSPAMISTAKQTLRSLAEKLEFFDITVNFIPNK